MLKDAVPIEEPHEQAPHISRLFAMLNLMALVVLPPNPLSRVFPRMVIIIGGDQKRTNDNQILYR